MISSVLKVITGILKVRGDTDGTLIGNVTDSLKTNVTASALPTGASTATNQTTANTSLSSIDTKLTSQATAANQSTLSTQVGIVTETAPASDTASSGLNGRLQRIAQRLTTLITDFTSGLYRIKIRGGTSDTNIGNVGDALKVTNALPNDYSRGVFGAARVVSTQNVFETLFSFDKQPLIWDEVLTTGGTSTFNTNTNSIDMATTTSSGSSVIRQTFRRVRYNPSRACQIITAAILGASKTNVRKRIGQFDTLDGLFFEQDGTGIYVVRRTSTSGSAVDTRVAQSAWNIDKFDGTGASGITIDFTKQQALFIQYAFQGFADITYGFYLGGQIVFCHKEQTANILSQPFMRTAHLPARVEITNTGAVASATTLSYNSFTIKNEGEDSDTEGQIRSYSSAPIKTVGTSVTPVLSVRLASGYERAIADVLKTAILVQTTDEVIWSVWIGATLTGSTFAVSASYTQIDTAATAMTGGTELISGILSQNASSANVSTDLLSLVNSLIGVSISGTSQVITLAGRSRIGTADVLSALVWREYP